jgi:hypothetical protein
MRTPRARVFCVHGDSSIRTRKPYRRNFTIHSRVDVSRGGSGSSPRAPDVFPCKKTYIDLERPFTANLALAE